MDLLYIKSYLEGDIIALKSKLMLIGILWVIVLVAIIIDLIFGIRKSLLAGDYTSSTGLRRTVTKVIHYYSVLLFCFLLDIILSLFWQMPLISAIGAGYLVYVEWVSVREKYDQKIARDMRGSLADLLIILREKDKIESVTKLIEKELEKQKEKESNTNVAKQES